MTNSNRKDPVVAVEVFHGMTCGLHGAEDVAKFTFLGDVDDAKQFVLRQHEFYGTISDYDYRTLRRSVVQRRKADARRSS